MNITSIFLFTSLFAKFINFVDIRTTTTMIVKQTFNGIVCITNTIVAGLIEEKLTNLVNTEDKDRYLLPLQSFPQHQCYRSYINYVQITKDGHCKKTKHYDNVHFLRANKMLLLAREGISSSKLFWLGEQPIA